MKLLDYVIIAAVAFAFLAAVLFINGRRKNGRCIGCNSCENCDGCEEKNESEKV